MQVGVLIKAKALALVDVMLLSAVEKFIKMDALKTFLYELSLSGFYKI